MYVHDDYYTYLGINYNRYLTFYCPLIQPLSLFIHSVIRIITGK